MAVLHLISSIEGLASCATRAAAQDVIVLMHDACYAITENSGWHRLASHAAARGLTASPHDIDFDRLVELTAEHQPVVTWR